MRYTCLAILMLTPVCLYGQAKAQAKKDAGADWPTYNRDLGGSRYSPLAQITTRNVANLKPAWSYKLQSDAPAEGRGRRGPGAGGTSEATPIVVNGVMYIPAANKIVALEPDTGKEL